MPNTDIYGLMSVKGGQKQKIMNFSNAREKTYAQYQQLTDAQKKGVIIVDDYPIPEESDSVSVTADGVKTWGTLLNELYALVDMSKVTDTTILKYNNAIYQLNLIESNALRFQRLSNVNTTDYNVAYIILRANSAFRSATTSASSTTFTTSTDEVVASGAVIALIYDYYKNLDIHTEYLAKNCMLTGGGNVEDDKVSKSGDTMSGNLSITGGLTASNGISAGSHSAISGDLLLNNYKYTGEDPVATTLEVGNSYPTNDGKSHGQIILHGADRYGMSILTTEATDALGIDPKEVVLPNASGTVALTSDLATYAKFEHKKVDNANDVTFQVPKVDRGIFLIVTRLGVLVISEKSDGAIESFVPLGTITYTDNGNNSVTVGINAYFRGASLVQLC